MLTYVDWTPGRWGRVRTELLRPCGLPVLYLTARDVPARRVLRTLRRLRRAGDVRCAILPDALAPRAAFCGIADPDEAALRRSLKRLAALDGDYRVFPGHEESTTLQRERLENPYVNGFFEE